MFRTEMMGTIYVTNSIEFVKTVPEGTVKIISLDEDGSLNDPKIIVGTCLLPPVESLIAEADGDEDLYDMNYVSYLNTPPLQQFITAIIGSLYRRNSLLLYAPQMYENNSIKKLRQFMWELYGIGIGVQGDPTSPCTYDPRCIPIWLNYMFQYNIIDPMEFLYEYPSDASIGEQIMNKLIVDIRPVGNTYEDRVLSIISLQRKIKENTKVTQPIFDTRSNDALLR